MITYSYRIEGTASEGQTWFVVGEVTAQTAGQFQQTVELAMRKSFMDLTNGEAVYGQPGKGCVGPYRVTKFVLEEKR